MHRGSKNGGEKNQMEDQEKSLLGSCNMKGREPKRALQGNRVHLAPTKGVQEAGGKLIAATSASIQGGGGFLFR